MRIARRFACCTRCLPVRFADCVRVVELALGGIVVAMVGFVVVQAAKVPHPPRVSAQDSATSSGQRPADPVQANGSHESETVARVVAAPRGTSPVHDDENANGGELASVSARTAQVNSGDTDISAMLIASDSVVKRWPIATARPIRVWIASASGTKDALPDAGRIVEKAFEQWDQAGTPVHFVITPDSARGDVRVGWTDHLELKRVGVTKMRGLNNYFVSGEITIATHRPSGDSMDSVETTRCIMHEIGHLLGLAHAADSASIMFPSLVKSIQNTHLTSRDLATVRLLYRLPVGRLN